MALWDIVQSKHVYSGSSLAFDSNVTAGNLIVVFFSGLSNATDFNWPTEGSAGGSYASARSAGWMLVNALKFDGGQEEGNNGVRSGISSFAWVLRNHPGGASTIYLNGTMGDAGIYIYEIDTQSNPTGVGILGSGYNNEWFSPFNDNGSGYLSYSARTLNPLHDGLLFSYIAQETNAQGSLTQPTGWSLGQNDGNHCFASAYVKCTGGSSYTQDWAWNNNCSVFGFASFGLWIGANEPQEPTAYYKLEEASGARVSERGSYDLTPTNTPGNAAGKIGNALDLVGASAQEVHSSNAKFQYRYRRQWCRAAWMRFSSTTTGQIPWSRDDVGSNRIAWLFLSNGTSKRLEFTNNCNGAQTTVANSFGDLSNDTWYFVAWGNNGLYDFISINGVLDQTAHAIDGNQVASEGATEMLGDRGAFSLPMTGRIDGYYYLIGHVSEETLAALYNSGSGDESWLTAGGGATAFLPAPPGKILQAINRASRW